MLECRHVMIENVKATSSDMDNYRLEKLIKNSLIVICMIPGSKGLSPHELAHRWVKDLGNRRKNSQSAHFSAKNGCLLIFCGTHMYKMKKEHKNRNTEQIR